MPYELEYRFRSKFEGNECAIKKVVGTEEVDRSLFLKQRKLINDSRIAENDIQVKDILAILRELLTVFKNPHDVLLWVQLAKKVSVLHFFG